MKTKMLKKREKEDLKASDAAKLKSANLQNAREVWLKAPPRPAPPPRAPPPSSRSNKSDNSESSKVRRSPRKNKTPRVLTYTKRGAPTATSTG